MVSFRKQRVSVLQKEHSFECLANLDSNDFTVLKQGTLQYKGSGLFDMWNDVYCVVGLDNAHGASLMIYESVSLSTS